MCLTGNSKIQHTQKCDDWTFSTTNWIVLIDAESFGSLMRKKNYTCECIWQVSKMIRNSSFESVIFILLSRVFYLIFHIQMAYHPYCFYSLIRIYVRRTLYADVYECQLEQLLKSNTSWNMNLLANLMISIEFPSPN